jgi:hypothetical protein
MLLLREQVLLPRAYRCPPPGLSLPRHLHRLQTPRLVSVAKSERDEHMLLEAAPTGN